MVVEVYYELHDANGRPMGSTPSDIVAMQFALENRGTITEVTLTKTTRVIEVIEQRKAA